jgi:hypothetical protein
MGPFLLSAAGPNLVSAQQGRQLAALLDDYLAEHLELLGPSVILDAAGVENARAVPLHPLLRVARKRLQTQHPHACLTVINLDRSLRSSLKQVLADRNDFRLEETEGPEMRLIVAYPEEVVDEDGLTVQIGAARRKMVAVIERDGPNCVWCGCELSYLHPEATLDHVRAQALDGSKAIGNLLLACAHCNVSRGHRSARAWMTRCLERGYAVNVDAVKAGIKRSQRRSSKRSQRSKQRNPNHSASAS